MSITEKTFIGSFQFSNSPAIWSFGPDFYFQIFENRNLIQKTWVRVPRAVKARGTLRWGGWLDPPRE